jgi:hypothetical protein
MKRTWILFAVLIGLITFGVRSYGQSLETTQVICAFNEKAPAVTSLFDVPFGAQHRSEVVWRKSAPENFHAVLALMQVVSVAPCPMQPGQEAKLTIKAIRLIERNPETGIEAVVSEVTDFSKKKGNFRFGGELYPRTPRWYAGSSEKAGSILSSDVSNLVIDLAGAPSRIFHGWTDPKVAIKPGMNYLVEMEVKLTGFARLQMGIDYWREIGSVYNEFDATCQKSNNCEGHLSRWYGPAKDGEWQTIRTPDALKK